jgi:hypothetical protein
VNTDAGTARYWAKQVQSLPIGSRERQVAFRHLAQHLGRSFTYPTLPVVTETDRTAICNTATQRTLAKLNQQLEQIDLNTVCIAALFTQELAQQDIPWAYQQWLQRQNTASLQPDTSLPPRFSSIQKSQIVQYIQHDPAIAQKCYRNNPAIRFQQVALMHMAGHSWQALEEHFNVSAFDLVKFYQAGIAYVVAQLQERQSACKSLAA